LWIKGYIAIKSVIACACYGPVLFSLFWFWWASVVLLAGVCRLSSSVTLPAGGWAGRRACGRSTAAGPSAWTVGRQTLHGGPVGYAPLGRHLVCIYFFVFHCLTAWRWITNLDIILYSACTARLFHVAKNVTEIQLAFGFRPPSDIITDRVKTFCIKYESYNNQLHKLSQLPLYSRLSLSVSVRYQLVYISIYHKLYW